MTKSRTMAQDEPINDSWRVVMFTAIAQFIPMTEGWLVDRGHRLVGLVASPGPRSRRTEEYHEVAKHARPGLDLVITNYPNRIADMIRPMRPDLIICAGFNWKIPTEVLELPRLGTLNSHDSLLPRYRGRNATGWALRNDEPEYGVTVHYMTPEFDKGPVLAQRRIAITDEDHSIESIIPRFLTARTAAWKEALDRVAAGDPGTPQEETQATYTGGAFEPEWREIDWSKPARDVFVQVRSWCGVRDVPRGAFGRVDGHQVLVTKARLTDVTSNAVRPGTVLEYRRDGSLLMQCGDGPLEILEWQEVGDTHG